MFRKMDEQELCALLSTGVDASGEQLSIEKLTTGTKTVKHLVTETGAFEVAIAKDEKTNRFTVYRRSVRILFFIDGYYYVEIGRDYRGERGFEPGRQLYTISGTLQQGEASEIGGAREIIEETKGLIIPYPRELIHVPGEFEVERESRVYPGLRSHVSFQLYVLNISRFIPRRLRLKSLKVIEPEVTVHIERFEGEPLIIGGELLFAS